MGKAKTIVWTAAVSVIAGMMPLGCVRHVNVPQGRLEETAMPPDEAMELRDWDLMTAYYTNPRFIAGPTGFWFRTPEEQTDFQHVYAVTEPLMFVGQTLFLPVALVITPPLLPVQYAGETLPPTYHAMPPLPPSPVYLPEPEWVEPMELRHPEMPDVSEPGVMPPPPYDPAPGETIIPQDPAPGPVERVPAPAPAPDRAPAPEPRTMTPPPTRTTITPAPPATQPVYVPSAVVPRRTAPTTLPATAPAEDEANK